VYWPPLGKLSLALHSVFGAYVQASFRYAPGGLTASADAALVDESAFVVQCEGAKTWRIYTPSSLGSRLPKRDPAADESTDGSLTAAALNASSLDEIEPAETLTLEEGDVMFLPRGTYQRTSTAPDGGHSLDALLSIEVREGFWSWSQVLWGALGARQSPDSLYKRILSSEGYILPARDTQAGKDNISKAQHTDSLLQDMVPIQMTRPGEGVTLSGDRLSKAQRMLWKHINTKPDRALLQYTMNMSLEMRQRNVVFRVRQLQSYNAQWDVSQLAGAASSATGSL